MIIQGITILGVVYPQFTDIGGQSLLRLNERKRTKVSCPPPLRPVGMHLQYCMSQDAEKATCLGGGAYGSSSHWSTTGTPEFRACRTDANISQARFLRGRSDKFLLSRFIGHTGGP